MTLPEWPEDMPEWAKSSPMLTQMWLDIDNFLLRVKTSGADPERARAKAIELLQDYPSMTWENARTYVLYEIALGNFQ